MKVNTAVAALLLTAAAVTGVVGAIGVSGGNGEQDVEISGAGVSASR